MQRNEIGADTIYTFSLAVFFISSFLQDRPGSWSSDYTANYVMCWRLVAPKKISETIVPTRIFHFDEASYISTVACYKLSQLLCPVRPASGVCNQALGQLSS